MTPREQEREDKINAGRLKALMTLQRQLMGMTYEQLTKSVINNPKYQPGDEIDDIIELCSTIASIRYFQEFIT